MVHRRFKRCVKSLDSSVADVTAMFFLQVLPSIGQYQFVFVCLARTDIWMVGSTWNLGYQWKKLHSTRLRVYFFFEFFLTKYGFVTDIYESPFEHLPLKYLFYFHLISIYVIKIIILLLYDRSSTEIQYKLKFTYLMKCQWDMKRVPLAGCMTGFFFFFLIEIRVVLFVE